MLGGGAFCNPDCSLIVGCGNGKREAGETCDDGNVVAGDGCSATCLWETTSEVEPNGTRAEADVALAAISGSTRITGAITPTGDQDFFKVVVAAQQVVRFEVFDSTGHDCTTITAAMRMRRTG